MGTSRWVTHRNGVGGHVLRYDRACADDGVLADNHASKDYERLTETSEAFIYVAMSRLMARRLARS